LTLHYVHDKEEDGTFSFWLSFVNEEENDDKEEDGEAVGFSGIEIMKNEKLIDSDFFFFFLRFSWFS
jgi:hypothetical protein